MLDYEWHMVGTHAMSDCWCGHDEPFVIDGKTLDQVHQRIHRWITLGCDAQCPMTSRVHGHVHVHCLECAKTPASGECCMP
jgi:hypothetical protein